VSDTAASAALAALIQATLAGRQSKGGSDERSRHIAPMSVGSSGGASLCSVGIAITSVTFTGNARAAWGPADQIVLADGDLFVGNAAGGPLVSLTHVVPDRLAMEPVWVSGCAKMPPGPSV
jgi:hypothetical protein